MGIELEIWLEELMYTEYLDMTPEHRLKHPCINICNGWLNDDGICTGCYRDIEQVTNWNSYSKDELVKQVKIIEERCQNAKATK